MHVHSCYVTDQNSKRTLVLDENGLQSRDPGIIWIYDFYRCAIDVHLLTDLDYLSDMMAGQAMHVFKYADQPSLAFQCKITLNIKEPDLSCLVSLNVQKKSPCIESFACRDRCVILHWEHRQRGVFHQAILVKNSTKSFSTPYLLWM